MNNIVPFQAKAPAEVVFLPEGVHKIHASTNGTAKQSTVRVTAARGPAIAAKLNQDLARRQGQNVRPWIDFGHAAGAAAALPKSYRYEPGKGIMLEVDWTDAGRRAIEGKDWSYFSPVFFLGDDGEPDGLPEKGPVGALVNEPAFREIPRIAASDASHPFLDRARSLVAAGDAPEIHAACCEVFAADGDAYKAYLAGLRTGKDQLNLVAAADLAECGGDPLKMIDAKAKALITAGQAKGMDEARGLIFAADNNAYLAYLEAGAPARTETMREIVEGLLASGEAKSEDDARVMAFERRPDLYQAMLNTAADLLGD